MRPAIDVILCSSGDWNSWESSGYVRRTSKLFQQLERDPEVRRILLVDTPKSWFGLARALGGRRRWSEGARSWDSPRSLVRQVSAKTTLLSFFVPLPREYGRSWVHRINRLFLDDEYVCSRVSAVVRDLGLRAPALWVDNPFLTHMIGRVGESVSLFDCIDDWRLNPRMAGLRDLLDRGYDAAIRSSDVFVTVSRPLSETFSVHRDDVRFIPNGVDAALFRNVERSVVPELVGLSRPRIGYIGSMGDRRIDEPLFREVAAGLPDASFVLVGSAPPGALTDLPNCHATGVVPYSRVPEFLHDFDVAILPHKLDGYNASAYPLKLLQYMAAGLPTVATPVSGTEDFGSLITVASDATEFVKGLRAGLNEANDSKLRALRRGAAGEASWEARYRGFRSLLTNARDERSASRSGLARSDGRAVPELHPGS